MLDSATSSRSEFSPPHGDEVGTPGSIASWAILPEELVHNILRHLPFRDLVTCQRLDRRTARVIRDNLVLPCAYWRKFNPAPSEESHSIECYLNNARDRLVAAGREDLVVWLDSLQQYRKFPKALFFAVSKMNSQADSLHVKKNNQFKIDRLGRRVTASPDGGRLIFQKGGWVYDPDSEFRILALDGSGWKVEHEFVMRANGQLTFYGCEICSRSMVLYSSNADFYIMDREGKRWVEKDHFQMEAVADKNHGIVAEFSPDESHLFLKRDTDLIWILTRSNNSWELMRILHLEPCIKSATWLVGHSRLYLSDLRDNIVVLKVDGEEVVEECHVRIPLMNKGSRISRCGTQIVSDRFSLLTSIISFTGGKWKECDVPSASVTEAAFSPDGNCLATLSAENWLRILFWDGSNWIVKTKVHYTRCEVWYRDEIVVFSPDSTTLLAIPSGSPPIYVRLTKGSWQVVTSRAEADSRPSCVKQAHFSPDGRTLVKLHDSGNLQVMRFVNEQWIEVFKKLHRYAVDHAYFTPDCRGIVVSSPTAGASHLELYEMIAEPRLQPQ